jgi:hypothetical protein
MTWFLLGIVVGMALLTAIAFIDAKIKKKKIQKMLNDPTKALSALGLDINKITKGEK